jgi:hypothetical protein
VTAEPVPVSEPDNWDSRAAWEASVEICQLPERATAEDVAPVTPVVLPIGAVEQAVRSVARRSVLLAER